MTIKGTLLASISLLVLTVCLCSKIAFSVNYAILSYIRIDILRNDGTYITKWIKAEEGTFTLTLPEGSKCLFLTLDQVAPFIFSSITDSLGVDITQDMRYYNTGYITPKYVFINLTKVKLNEIVLKVTKSKSFPLIYEVSKCSSANLGEVAIPSSNSRKFSIGIEDCMGIMLNLVMLSEGRIFLNASSVNLLSLECKSVEIPGIGSKNVKLLKYIVFDDEIEIVNLGTSDVIALINITPLIINDVGYYVYKDFILINNSSIGVVLLNLPDFVEIIDVSNGVLSKQDPLFSKPLPPRLHAVNIKKLPLEIRVRLKKGILLVNDIEGKPVKKATLRLTYSSEKIKYIECKNQVEVEYELVPYVLVDVFMEGFKVSSFNVTSFPNKITLYSNVSPLIVYVVDDEGRPLCNAQVYLFSYLSYQMLKATSDQEGKVMFHDIPLHCNYTLIVKFRGQEVAKLTFKIETQEAKLIRCDVGTIRLIVCDQRNRRINNVRVQLFSGKLEVANLIMNETNEPTALLIPFSTYRVKVFSHSLCLYEGQLKISKSGTYAIVINSYKLIVKVKDVLGVPLRNVKVALMLIGSENAEVDIKQTDYNGVVTFYNLPKGNYTVRVRLGNTEEKKLLVLKDDTYIEIKLLTVKLADTIYLPLEGIVIATSATIIGLLVMIVIKIKKRNIVIIE